MLHFSCGESEVARAIKLGDELFSAVKGEWLPWAWIGVWG